MVGEKHWRSQPGNYRVLNTHKAIPVATKHNIFALVGRSESLKIMLSIAAQERLICYQCDIASAFLYASLDEITYMEVQKGVNANGFNPLLLKKALYGLRCRRTNSQRH